MKFKRFESISKSDYTSVFKTRQQIAEEYGFSVQTLRKKLRQYQIVPPAGLIAPHWQKIIYDKLGYPPNVHSFSSRK